MTGHGKVSGVTLDAPMIAIVNREPLPSDA
jgi:hypothetical protein